MRFHLNPFTSGTNHHKTSKIDVQIYLNSASKPRTRPRLLVSTHRQTEGAASLLLIDGSPARAMQPRRSRWFSPYVRRSHWFRTGSGAVTVSAAGRVLMPTPPPPPPHPPHPPLPTPWTIARHWWVIVCMAVKFSNRQ